MNGNVSEWLSAVDGLADVHARLRRVLVENMPALQLIPRADTPETLFYCDPPYLHQTRASTDAYAHEMTEADHRELRIAKQFKVTVEEVKAIEREGIDGQWPPLG
jgi:DNA adenine methylase